MLLLRGTLNSKPSRKGVSITSSRRPLALNCRGQRIMIANHARKSIELNNSQLLRYAAIVILVK